MPDNREVSIAIGLMRAALARLDREREPGGAMHLRQAIATTLAARRIGPDEEVSTELACLIAGVPLGAQDGREPDP